MRMNTLCVIGLLALGMSGVASADGFGIGPQPGHGGPGNGGFYPQQNTQTYVINCQSYPGQTSQCEVQGTIVSAYLQQDLSGGRCYGGQTFSFDQSSIYVWNGCSGNFVVTIDTGYNPQPQPWPQPNPQPWPQPQPQYQSRDVDCDSNGDKYRECNSGLNQVQDIYVVQQQSHAECREGKSFGITGNRIWVNRGCRAIFRVTGY